jgi:hypothetical protein
MSMALGVASGRVTARGPALLKPFGANRMRRREVCNQVNPVKTAMRVSAGRAQSSHGVWHGLCHVRAATDSS